MPTPAVSRILARSGAVVAIMVASACQHVPELEDFDHYEATYREMAGPEFARLAEDRAAGRISEAEYALETALLEERITARAHEAIYNHMRLRNEQDPGETLFAGGGNPGGIRGSRGGGGGGSR